MTAQTISTTTDTAVGTIGTATIQAVIVRMGRAIAAVAVTRSAGSGVTLVGAPAVVTARIRTVDGRGLAKAEGCSVIRTIMMTFGLCGTLDHTLGGSGF